MRESRFRLPAPAADLAGSSHFAATLSTATIGALVFTHAIRATIGWPGYNAILAGLVVLAGIALAARSKDLEWHGVLPISLLLFLGWCALSLLWSEYQWATLSGIAYQLTVAFLAVFVALARDLIQIVRAFGDVLRVFLVLSLALEVLSGLLLDLPIRFLGMQGNLAAGGPIQGLAGSRNMMGLLAVIALITFAVELATRSVRRSAAQASILLAAIALLLTNSPVALGVAAMVGLLALALHGIRRTAAERRPVVQAVTLGSAFVAVLVAYVFRTRLVDLVGANEELGVRFALWRSISFLMPVNPLEGFGWVGSWRPELLPFAALRTINDRVPTSALNAFVDTWFQAGLVGAALFAVLLGLALVRAWLVAGTRRNVAHVWSALILVALGLTGAAESAILVEYSWMLLVICSVKAAQELSWRRGLRD
ncbi:MAG TPA: O-antigen ligase family protein [Naasia sp.]|jgi:O-antigen ligase